MKNGRLVHVSDIHFGRIDDDRVVDALIEDINSFEPEAVVISGDMTQRSRPREWAGARNFVSRIEAPWIAVPGNHDVWPWWHPIQRLRTPVSRYQDEFCQDLAPILETESFAIVGLNSAHGFTVKGGKLSKADIAGVAVRFTEFASGLIRVIVLHHPPVSMEGASRADIASGGSDLMVAAAKSHAQLMLCGHLHRSQTRAAGDLLLVASGTATSNRSREPRPPDCRYFQLSAHGGEVRAVERRWESGAWLG